MTSAEPAPVLWYVHHHGSGHWRRALAVTDALRRPVVLASSAPPPRPPAAPHRVLRLPADAPAEHPSTAHGRLHWAPLHHRGMLDRHRLLLDEIASTGAVLAVVDVSVEIAVLLRTSGVPVLAVRLPGERPDAPHALGFGLADQVVVPVPAGWGLHGGVARTTAVGLVSGLQPRPPDERSTGVLVLVGGGGSALDPAECRRLAAACPGRTVRVLGVAPDGDPGLPNLEFVGHRADPAAELAAAGVVVANCGLGSVADVARAARPLVAVPADRPFGEQAATAAALADHAVVVDALPPAGGWAAVIDRAERRGAPELDVHGAARFAALVARFAWVEEARRGPVAGPPVPADAASPVPAVAAAPEPAVAAAPEPAVAAAPEPAGDGPVGSKSGGDMSPAARAVVDVDAGSGTAGRVGVA